MEKLNKLNKRLIFLLTLFVLVILLLMLKQQTVVQTDKYITKACFKQQCFNVKVLDNDEERTKGLMYVNNLTENSGMLFIFPNEDEYSFWMKDTLIPLDIVWIDNDFKVVSIKENAIPCNENPCEVYAPNSNAKYVLEINSELVKKYGIKVGDKVEFE